jgi:hypothetical protein
MFLMVSCWKYHGVGQWKLELRYPTLGGTYSYNKLRERKMRNCAGTFLLLVEQQQHRLTMTTKSL